MRAEDKIAKYNYRKPNPADGRATYASVCAACGIELNDRGFDADQRVNGWPVCLDCFLEE